MRVTTGAEVILLEQTAFCAKILGNALLRSPCTTLVLPSAFLVATTATKTIARLSAQLNNNVK